jgi:hypothetical protein
MYPALALGAELEKSARSVRSHSTTRSPLLPGGAGEGGGCPISARHAFPSLYDGGRASYLYNLGQCDTAVVVTDAPDSDGGALIRALQGCGASQIYFVRVLNAD